MSIPTWWSESEEDIMKRLLSKIDKKWDKRQGGFIYDVLKPIAIERKVGREEFMKWHQSNFAQYATGTDLDLVVADKTPLTRYPARKARGPVVVEGNEGTKLIKGATYISIRYELNNKIIEYKQLEEAVIGADGTAKVEVECVTPGIIGNTVIGTVDLGESIFGVSSVRNPEKITGGEEAESDEDLRSRYFAYLRESSNSGNIGDYIRWSLSVKNVGGVLVFPIANGKGTVKIMLCDYSFVPATPELIQQVQQFLNPTIENGDGKAPIGASVSVVPAIPVKINITVKVTQGGNTEENKQNLIKEATEYLKQCNKAYWRDDASRQSILKESYVVNYLKLGAVAVDVFKQSRVNEMVINGLQKDVVITSGQIAVLGEVVISEEV
ncbi:baseplate J/gp47 family protein [Bacillus pretiosus]|uniref:baseplate J/gp47 family protein n=1 Tax=Bacillus pretiosus TaxID=2983392 RepID=UPI003D646921